MVYQATDSGVLTADEFLWHPAAKQRTELVRGHIQFMTPVGLAHGLVGATVLRLLSTHVWQHRLGACFDDSTGYALPNLTNTVRAPDASFVRADRLQPMRVDSGFHKIAPDLAVEVLSPSERPAEIAEKLADYRSAGTPLVWVIDPAARTVMVVSNDGSRVVLRTDETLTGGDVVPGFSCTVGELFDGLATTEG